MRICSTAGTGIVRRAAAATREKGTAGLEPHEGNILGLPAGNLSVSGTIKLDGNGNAFIHQWEVINGFLLSTAGSDYTGTYTLNPDCTFSATLTGLPGPAFVGVVADNGRQIRAMITAPGVQVNFTNTIRVHP